MELVVNTVEGWSAPDTSICIGASALVDRTPLQFAERDSADRALASLLAAGAWGAPVLDDHGRYLGACTLRRFTDLALPVSAADANAVQSLNFLREGANQLGARLAASGGTPVSRLLDADVPTIRGSQSLPQALLLLVQRSPMVPVLDDLDGHVIGVVTLQRALEAIHARSRRNAHLPA